MSKHHPSINLLTEYCAGTLGTAQALSVTAHLHYCHSCRCQVGNLNRLNGSIFSDTQLNKKLSLGNSVDTVSESHSVETADLFQSTLAKIDALEKSSSDTNDKKNGNAGKTCGTETPNIANKLRKDLPPVIAKLIVKPHFLKWKALSPSMQAARLTTGQNECEVSLIKIKAGGKVLEHDHQGNEYTVVLRGAFSDHNGIYSAGDFIHRQTHDVHAPNATADADCLCLTVVDAPLKFTGLWGYLINPFMTLKPC